jgi:hypothetical protein
VECPRCKQEMPDDAKHPWCAKCELEYDGWSRRHASDIIASALSGTVVVVVAAVVVPLAGLPWMLATAGVFAGFATLVGVQRLQRRRRRTQFLRGEPIPTAYLRE